MLAGPEVGYHFTLKLYNKVTPTKISDILGFFFQTFFFVDIFLAVYMYSPKKSRIRFLVFAKIRWVKV